DLGAAEHHGKRPAHRIAASVRKFGRRLLLRLGELVGRYLRHAVFGHGSATFTLSRLWVEPNGPRASRLLGACCSLAQFASAWSPGTRPRQRRPSPSTVLAQASDFRRP